MSRLAFHTDQPAVRVGDTFHKPSADARSARRGTDRMRRKERLFDVVKDPGSVVLHLDPAESAFGECSFLHGDRANPDVKRTEIQYSTLHCIVNGAERIIDK